MGALVVVEPVEGFSRIPQNGKFATTLLTSGGALREQGSSAVFGLWMCGQIMPHLEKARQTGKAANGWPATAATGSQSTSLSILIN